MLDVVPFLCLAIPGLEPLSIFDLCSIIFTCINTERGRMLTLYSLDTVLAAREREKANLSLAQTPTPKPKKIPSQIPSANTSRAASPKPSQLKSKVQSMVGGVDQQQFDMASLNLQNNSEGFEEEVPKVTLAREQVLQQARAALEGDNQGKRGISLVVIGAQLSCQI